MRPTRALVDLTAVARNVRALRGLTAAGVRQMAVVKADAYGHGAVPVARAALGAGAEWLGVALVEEGADLRRAGIEAPILLLGAAFPEEAADAVGAGLTVAVCGRETALALDRAGAAQGRTAAVHVKVDTGMGRLGVPPAEAAAYTEWLSGLPHLRVEGLFSHFSAADEADLSFSRAQLEELLGVRQALAARGLRPPLCHIANTAAVMALPESHLDLVRTGIGIYGLHPSPETPRTADLEPALRLTTRVAHVKDVPAGTPLSYGRTFVARQPSRIATLPVGYGDGYPRLLSNRGQVLIGGRAVPIVGRVCMDLILADATSVPEARVGDEAVLIGPQGDASIGADELARLVGTIHYEITCNIGKRVPREYRG
ncbi:MAG: alanine racemase [Deferrisomatales bacterium]|nr:alanine racemase [Deferrisomatales bacterium]